MLRVDRECFGPWPPVTMEVASSREVECRVADEAACARYPQDSQGGQWRRRFGLPATRQRQETRGRSDAGGLADTARKTKPWSPSGSRVSEKDRSRTGSLLLGGGLGAALRRALRARLGAALRAA